MPKVPSDRAERPCPGAKSSTHTQHMNATTVLSDPSTREVATVTVDVGASVADVLDLMTRTGQATVIVTEFGKPVGVVTRDGLRGDARSARGESRVEDVLTWELVESESGADVLKTLDTYTSAAWASLRRRGPCDEEAMTRRAAAWDPADESASRAAPHSGQSRGGSLAGP